MLDEGPPDACRPGDDVAVSPRACPVLTSERIRDGAASPSPSEGDPVRDGGSAGRISTGLIRTGDACAAGGRAPDDAEATCDGGWPDGAPGGREAGAGAPAAGWRDVAPPDAWGCRDGLDADGAVPLPECGVAVERFSTGAGRGAAHPDSIASDVSAIAPQTARRLGLNGLPEIVANMFMNGVKGCADPDPWTVRLPS